MPSALIGGAVSGVGSLIGGILGHGAATNAGRVQSQADQQAAALAANAGQQAQGFQTGQIAGEKAAASPYTTLGASTAQSLTNALAPGGALTQGWNQTFSAPTAQQASETPGYQFQVQQATNALDNSAAARGGLLSTGTAKNLLNYTNGLASTNYQNTYNNALQTYNTNLGTFETNQNNLYNRLSGATNTGLNAVNNLNNVTQSGTNALTAGIMDTAKTQGQDIMGAGQAQAAGIVGSTNALTAGLGGAGNAIGQGVTLQGILGAQNASNSGNTSGAFDVGNPYASSGNTGFINSLSTNEQEPSWVNN
jgi:hypothetical protein